MALLVDELAPREGSIGLKRSFPGKTQLATYTA